MSGNTHPVSLLLATGVAVLFVAAVGLEPSARASGSHRPGPCEPPPWAHGALADVYAFFKGCDRCDDGNPCTQDSKRWGRCIHAPLDGHRCDDGNACTRRDACHAGVCEGAPRECDAAGACHAASCNPKNGKCVAVPQTGSPCDDGNACTDADTCVAGSCLGSQRDCSSDDPCQVGACTDGGCEFTAVSDGTPCDDGNVCDGAGSCRAGRCVVVSDAPIITVGSADDVPMLVEAAPDGHVFLAANVIGQQVVAGQRVQADAEGDIFITELDLRGQPVFSTLIAGKGRQQVLSTSLDAKQSLQLFLETDQSIGFELDVQTCELRDGIVFCTPPPPVTDECSVVGPDGEIIPCGVCGNGVVDQPSERCDDGNLEEDDECTTDCLPPCICNDNGCDCEGPENAAPNPPLPPLPPIAPVDPNSPVAGQNLTARAAAPIAAAAGAPLCVVPGSPSIPGNAQVTLLRGAGLVTLVLVYPDLGAGGVWRPVYQAPTETHYVFGHTPNLTVFNPTPAVDGSNNLIAGSYSLATSASGCVQLATLPLASRGAWGSPSPERAEFASVSGGKLVLASSYAETFELGGATVTFPPNCSTTVLGAYSVAALAPVAEPEDLSASLASSPPPSMAVCVVPAPPPPPPPPAARAALPAVAPAEATLLPIEIPSRGPALLTTPSGVWWAGAANRSLTLETSSGPVEVPLLGEGLDTFLVLMDASGGAQPVFATDGPGDEAVRVLASDGDDVVLAGVFDTRIQLGDARFFSKGGRDIFVAKLSPSGDLLFRAAYGGPGEDTPESLSVTSSSGVVQLSVLTEGGIDFGAGALAQGSYYVRLPTSSDPAACSSDHPCSVGGCDPVKGCVFSDAPDGTPCRELESTGKCRGGLCCIDGACD